MCVCVSESIRVPLCAHRGGFEVNAECVSLSCWGTNEKVFTRWACLTSRTQEWQRTVCLSSYIPYKWILSGKSLLFSACSTENKMWNMDPILKQKGTQNAMNITLYLIFGVRSFALSSSLKCLTNRHWQTLGISTGNALYCCQPHFLLFCLQADVQKVVGLLFKS